MKLSFLFSLIFILSCTTKQKDKAISTTDTSTSAEKSILADTLSSNAEIIETFTDSVNIGNKGNCKIELIKHRVFDDVYVIVKFYTRELRYWNMKDTYFWEMQNTYFYECEAPMDLTPNISDFNNDKFNDITFISATAARGANEVRRLFIYNDKLKELISIVNSEHYPNMLYNKELDCIDAFLVHGGTTTVFAKIKADSLKKFAGVNNDNYNRTVYEVDKLGNEKIVRNDTVINFENVYVRYINYKPLKAYKN
jgi:hypothetical protein